MEKACSPWGLLPGPWKNVAQVKARGKTIGDRTFSEENLRYFKTKVGTRVLYGRFFVTSECARGSTERSYTVRYATDYGYVDTVPKFMGSSRRHAAETAVRRLVAPLLKPEGQKGRRKTLGS